MYAAFGEETSIKSLTELRNGAPSLRQNKSWLSARRNKGLTIESTIFPISFIDCFCRKADTAGEFGERYGTGSGSDLAPSEVAACKAPGRYRSLYRTNSPAVS